MAIRFQFLRRRSWQIDVNHRCWLCFILLRYFLLHLNCSCFRDAGQVVEASAKTGFSCRNSRQPEGRTCHNYKIRFCCPAGKQMVMKNVLYISQKCTSSWFRLLVCLSVYLLSRLYLIQRSSNKSFMFVLWNNNNNNNNFIFFTSTQVHLSIQTQ